MHIEGKGSAHSIISTERNEVSPSPRAQSQPPPSVTESVQVVGPTSARSLRGQSSKSFAARNKDSPVTVVPGSSANPIIAPANLDSYIRIGMVPAPTGETAQQARSRHNANETHITTFLTTFERNVASQDRVHRDRMEELGLLIQEVRAASDREPQINSLTLGGLVESPVIQQLHSAVVEDRNRITELVSALQRVENQMENTNKTLQTSSLPLPVIPAVHPSVSPMPTRPLEDPVMPPAKRFKTLGQRYPDVLYGPVDSDGSPRAIANAAMRLITGLQESDIFNARYAPGQPGVISIRFRDHAKAGRFMSAIHLNPLIQGQTAVPAEDGVGAENIGQRQQAPSLTPLDIIRGVGKTPRRR